MNGETNYGMHIEYNIAQYNTALRKRENFDTWMNLEDMLLSKISEAQKHKYCTSMQHLDP